MLFVPSIQSGFTVLNGQVLEGDFDTRYIYYILYTIYTIQSGPVLNGQVLEGDSDTM